MSDDNDEVEPPRKSPRAKGTGDDEEERDDRTITGVYAAVDAQRKRWSGIAVFVGVIAAGLLAIGKIASAQTDAGIQNTNIRLQQLEQAHKNHIEDEHQVHLEAAKRFDRQDDAIEVTNKKLTLLLDAAEVPRWKRPAEVPPAHKDGGS